MQEKKNISPRYQYHPQWTMDYLENQPINKPLYSKHVNTWIIIVLQAFYPSSSPSLLTSFFLWKKEGKN